MAIPAYAEARIDYLRYRYNSIPKVVYFDSKKESAFPKYGNSKEASIFIDEAAAIGRSYFCKPKSKPEFISKPLRQRQKEAIARALKQVEDGI
jgi:hypothetical protein